MTRRLRDDSGFTLIELLVAMGIMLVVVAATLTVFEGAQRTSNRAQMQNDAQDQARNALDRMARELRNQATPTNAIPIAIEKATAQDIILIDVASTKPAGSLNARNISRVRYCLNPTTKVLWSQKQTWTTAAAPAAPASSACPGVGGWTQSTPLTDRVVNAARPVFTFGPSTWATTDLITSIDARVFIDAQPTYAPPETTLSTRVSLRNQNRMPVPNFQAKVLGDGHVLLVGTGSSDPEGQGLTYTWRYNGAVITACDSATCDFDPPVAGTHSFGLTVTDPSGLSANAPNQSVNVS